ncbi:MAG: efflux RND transporter permease subunit [Opitutales bacterium]|nr:efflux RND transporter permease subunit [Opitutales bacterium]
MNIAHWSVHNRVAVNMIAISILILGIFLVVKEIQRDVFPDVSTNFITITTIDLTTGTPEDIERLITIPLEEEIADVEGVVNIVSLSEENISTIFMEIDADITNLDPILNDTRQQVSRARPDLPPSAEEPIVEEFDIPIPLMTLGVKLPTGTRAIDVRDTMDALERDLKIVRGVSDVLVDGIRDREIWVETDPFISEALGIPLTAITQAIRERNQDRVAGRIEGIGGERVVRMQGQIQDARELTSVPLTFTGDGVIRLRDVATVRDTMEEARTEARVNLREAVSFTIIQSKGADALETAAEIRQVLTLAEESFPEGLEATVVADTTKYIDVRIRTVVQNGIQALVIVTVLLVSLLNWRLAILIAIGLPISFAGTFIVLYFSGESLNIISLFALIMALGMIVDDAVVIAENVYRYFEEGYSRLEAAVKGTTEVIWPVVGSVSTTMAAFLPLILGEGVIGKILFVIPVVVISGLLFSLIQAFIILPSHMFDFIHLPKSIPEMERKRTASRNGFEKILLTLNILYWETRGLVNFLLREIINTYTYLLKICLRIRYAVIGGFILLLFGGLALVKFEILQFELFSTDFADRLTIKLDFPASFSLDQTATETREIEEKIINTLPETDLLSISTRIGTRLDDSNNFNISGSNLAFITLDLDEDNPEARLPSVIVRDLQNLINAIPAVVQGQVEAEGGGPPVGRPVNVQIMGENFSDLQAVADEVEQRLRSMPGIRDVANDFERGKPEFVFRVDEEKAAAVGVSVAAVGEALQAAYRGLEASRFRQGNDEVVIRVRLAERWQRDPAILRGLRIATDNGGFIALEELVELSEESGLPRINRRNQRRVITVSSEIDSDILTSRRANAEIETWLPGFLEEFPEIRFNLAGENEDTERSLEAMRVAALIAFLLIYAILAFLFNSFVQPVVVMSVIPFGIIGVIGGLVIMGEPLGLMAIMGTIALAGIVVNNSVVFVHFINRERRKHAPDGLRAAPLEHARYLRWYSIIHSARIRFRPIFLTTATTIGGLFTLAFLTDGQEEFLAPMAQAIVFGLLFASAITMILIPCLYSITDDLKGLFRKRPQNSEE